MTTWPEPANPSRRRRPRVVSSPDQPHTSGQRVDGPATNDIRQRHPIQDVVAASGVQIRPSGRGWLGCCALHEDTTRSLSVAAAPAGSGEIEATPTPKVLPCSSGPASFMSTCCPARGMGRRRAARMVGRHLHAAQAVRIRPRQPRCPGPAAARPVGHVRAARPRREVALQLNSFTGQVVIRHPVVVRIARTYQHQRFPWLLPGSRPMRFSRVCRPR